MAEEWRAARVMRMLSDAGKVMTANNGIISSVFALNSTVFLARMKTFVVLAFVVNY